MYYCLMYLFCWCLSEFHPSIDLSFAFLLPTTTFHVAGVGWSVQVHSLSGGLSKTSSAAWTNAYFKCSSPSLATLFLCLSLEFCRILRWPKSQFGWRRLRNLCILQLDYVFAYVTLIKYTYLLLLTYLLSKNMADKIENTHFVFGLSKILGPKTLVSRSNQQGSNQTEWN